MRESPLSLEELREAFATLSKDAAPGPDCPAAESILEAVRGVASTTLTAAVVDHTSRCYACAEAWRLAREIAANRLSVATTNSRQPAFRSPAWGVWTSLAAAALVLIAVGLDLFVLPRSPQPIVTRAGEETAIRSLVPETTPLPRDACVLRWSAPPGDARYNIRVGTQDLTRIGSARGLEKPEYRISPESLEMVPAGATIVWRVEAVLPDGRRMESPTFMNRVE